VGGVRTPVGEWKYDWVTRGFWESLDGLDDECRELMRWEDGPVLLLRVVVEVEYFTPLVHIEAELSLLEMLLF
jgi:hypothetical protein